MVARLERPAAKLLRPNLYKPLRASEAIRQPGILERFYSVLFLAWFLRGPFSAQTEHIGCCFLSASFALGMRLDKLHIQYDIGCCSCLVQLLLLADN